MKSSLNTLLVGAVLAAGLAQAAPSPMTYLSPSTSAADRQRLAFQMPGGVNAQTGTTYTVLGTDGGQLVTFTNAAAMAVTLPQAVSTGVTSTVPASFGPQWSTCFKNINAVSTSATAAGNTAFVTITPTTSTIDGAASVVLGAQQGICVYSDGTNYRSSGIIGSTDNNVRITATGTTTWTKPPNILFVKAFICGGGAGGGSGTSSATDGAGGGGGGWCEERTFNASDVASTVTVTVGVGGAGGLHGSTVAQPGGQSSFGSMLTAFGGGGGAPAGAAVGGGGGPGGPFGVGGIGTTACGAAGTGTGTGTGQVFGPSCGANGTTTTGAAAASSGFNSGGGGSGGNGNNLGGVGGQTRGCTSQNGGSGTASGTGGTPSAPTVANDMPGCGGSGGGGATTGTGGNGGPGGVGGGGGGGAGSATGAGTGGDGGVGGAGIAIIRAW